MLDTIAPILSPWASEFEHLIETSESIDFASPFIKHSAIQPILSYDVRIRGLTELSAPTFVRGASDVLALETLLDHGADLRSLFGLHAKIFLFDDKAVVTSANLTEGGLKRNIEYGFLISDSILVENVRNDFDEMFDEGVVIDSESVAWIKRVIDEASEKIREFHSKDSIGEYIDPQIVLDSLVGWKKEVYKVILQLEETQFSLQQVYQHKPHFSRLYPKNKHIEAKIRQTLQYLRDDGLILFLDEPGEFQLLVDGSI